MVLPEHSVPESTEEADKLRQLLDCASDLSRASLLSLLRRCKGDVDAAMAQLWSLGTAEGSGDHMEQYGSTQYDVEDDDEGAEYGGKWGATSSDEDEAAAAAAVVGADTTVAALNDDDDDDDGAAWAAQIAARAADGMPTVEHHEDPHHRRRQRDHDDDHRRNDDEASDQYEEEAFYETSLAGGLTTRYGGTATTVAGSYQRPTLMCGGIFADAATGLPGFINEGIRLVDFSAEGGGQRRDLDAATTVGAETALAELDAMVVRIDLAVMDEACFESLLDDWLMDGVDCVDDAVIDDFGGGADDPDFDWGTDGEAGEAVPRMSRPRAGAAAPVLRSDPAEFRAYLEALLSEDSEARAKRIEQERLDEFLAQQLYEDELKAFEKDEQRRYRDSVQAVHREEELNPHAAAASAAGAGSWPKKRPTGPKLRRIAPAVHTAPERTSHSVGVTVATGALAKKGAYRPRQVHVVLPKACKVVAVQNIVNRTLERRFAAAAVQLRQLGYATRVDMAYHGTDASTSYLIAQGGFIAPRSNAGHGLNHRSGNSGFYGNGIYLSPHPTVAQAYANGGRLLVCNVLRGHAYRCTGMMLGAGLSTGYSSHESPDGREWVFFNTAQVLPVAVIHFGSQAVAYPRVLPPLVHDGAAADSSALALAGRAQHAPSVYAMAQRRAHLYYPANAAARRTAAKLESKEPTQHFSNRERQAINRAQKGKTQQRPGRTK